MKKIILLFVFGMAVLLLSFSTSKQEFSTKDGQSSFFKEPAEYGRLDFRRTDNQFISLGKVVVTIEQKDGRFKLYAIDDNIVKMDSKSWGENGEVRDWPEGGYFAHWYNHGVPYMVFFNSKRIRDYRISH
jgi:hypothetical protein